MNDAITSKVFVTDFDGTLAGEDFYNLFVSRLYPPGAPDYWSECVAGRITHFEALRNIFAYAPVGEAALLSLLKDMRLPPDLPQRVTKLRECGWRVVVASAGCRWYIERLLEVAGVNLPIYANDGRLIDGRLVMEMPEDPTYATIMRESTKRRSCGHFPQPVRPSRLPAMAQPTSPPPSPSPRHCGSPAAISPTF